MLRPQVIWIIIAAVSLALITPALNETVAAPKKPAEKKVEEPAEQEGEFPKEWFAGEVKTRTRHRAMMGKPLPATDADDWVGGIGMADLRNKVGVVVLWTTFDDPSIKALGKLEAIREKYKDKPLAIVAIATHSGQERAQRVAKEQKVNFAVGLDGQYKTMRAWNPTFWPMIAVVDKTGNIRAFGLKTQYVEAAVVTLLKEQGALPADYVVPVPSTQPATKPSAQPTNSPTTKPAKKAPADKTIPRDWLRGTDAERERLSAIDVKKPPTLALNGWHNGDAQTLESLKGKVVLLDFLNASSGVSIAATKRNQELSDKFKGQGLVVIGICKTSGGDSLSKMIEARKVTYSCAIDDADATTKAYAVTSYDSYYLIDRKGTLRVADCEKGSLEDAIQLLLKEPAPLKPGEKPPPAKMDPSHAR